MTFVGSAAQTAYPFEVLGVHVALALVLFFIINWLGKRAGLLGYMQLSVVYARDEAPAFNFLLRTLTPIVYLVIVAMALFWLKRDQYVKNIYLVSVYYSLGRLLWNLLLGRARLLNWVQQVIYFVTISGLSYGVYMLFMRERTSILPDRSLANELWLLVIIFLYRLFDRTDYGAGPTRARKDRYIIERYFAYREEFGKVVSDMVGCTILEPVVYAIIVVEAFNRPKIARWLERRLFSIGAARTLGIMQVRTTHMIDDQTSLKLGIEKLIRDFNQSNVELTRRWRRKRRKVRCEEAAIDSALLLYNPSREYVVAVLETQAVIIDRFYPWLKGTIALARGDRA